MDLEILFVEMLIRFSTRQHCVDSFLQGFRTTVMKIRNPNRWTACASAVAMCTFTACSSNEQHTTAITYISPPPVQVLKVVTKPMPPRARDAANDPTADPKQPMLVFRLENGRKFRPGEDVPIDFSVLNAKLKDEGGDFRVRYIVDDEDMKWLGSAEPFWLSGWTPGEHIIRVELIGPDGWPYRNGNANIVTKKISVETH